MQVAEAFCDARRNARALDQWPGPFPETLDEAYAIQRAAIARWGPPVDGVKVGRITGEAAVHHGRDRFIGPMFAPTIIHATDGAMVPFPIIPGGSAALECELVAILGPGNLDAAANGDSAVLRQIVASWHIGIEIAGSPMAGVDRLGPLASIACFGNNTGCIVGPAFVVNPENLDDMRCSCLIDGVEIADDTPKRLPGGVWGALAFGLAETLRQGIEVSPGFAISTGAITGMHAFSPGSRGVADFGSFGHIACVGVDASGRAPHPR